MTRRQRIINLGIAAVIAVIAVVVILATSGGSDDAEREAASASPTPAQTEAAVPTPSEDATSTPTVKPEEPEPPRIEVKNGKVVGGVAKFRVKEGERLRFSVTSDVADHVHVHAYDFMKDVTPGKAVRFNFKADITGITEIELEDSGLEIASLRVDP